MILYPIWLFLSAIFFYFAYVNWRQAQSSLRPFQFRHRPGPEGEAGKEAEMDPVIKDFVGDFNRYLDSVNDSNRRQRRATAVGFMIAGVVALVSMFVILGSASLGG